MSSLQQTPLVTAWIADGSSWRWDLRIDDRGLFRWYLDGVVATHLRGCSREHAEAVLRRFVSQSLKGDLRVTDAAERMGPDSERPLAARTAAGTA